MSTLAGVSPVPLLATEGHAKEAAGGRRRDTPAFAAGAVIAGAAILLTVLICWPRSELARNRYVGTTLLSQEKASICGTPVPRVGGVPWVQVLGGPPMEPVDLHWIRRVCTPLYPGPNCSNATTWRGTVTLCVDGKPIQGVKMHTRGHVSKMFPKQQFSLKLPTSVGLFGMASARKWIIATSFIDTSFQRNPFAFHLHRQLGGWAAQTRYVNLQIQGQSYGLYTIGERIQRSSGRLHLPKSRKQQAHDSGYLLTVDWEKPGKSWVESPNTSTVFSFLYPKRPSRQQHSFVQRLVNEIDSAALVALTCPPSHGCGDDLGRLVDFSSFARFFIIEELAKDVDGYAFSVFVAIERGRLVHAAPWDFDLAFGFDCQSLYYHNALTGVDTTGTVTGWNVENLRDTAAWIGPTGWPGGAVWEFGLNKRQLFLNIWRDPGFRTTFMKTWQSARRAGGVLSSEELQKAILHRADSIAVAAEEDMHLWRGTERCAFWTCCNPSASQDFGKATEKLLQFVLARAAWIDTAVLTLLGAAQ